MSEIIAPIIRERPEDYDAIEKMIGDIFRDEIYLPLIEILGLNANKVLNSNKSFLLEKISDGKIAYYRGEFSGKFSARSTKAIKEMGGIWDPKTKSFKLRKDKLPKDVMQAIAVSATRFEKTIDLIREKLRKILPAEIAESLKAQNILDRSIFNIDKGIGDSLESIKVVPQLTDDERHQIAVEYNTNMQRSIKGWTEKEVIKLRTLVEREALGGKRYENLADIIKKQYNVSKNKAKFLARQETGLLMAKFRESRYVAAGSEGYYWMTVAGSPKHPVRPMHKELNGKFIEWKNPPITNSQGNRNHAGEDYNCRCAPRAVIKF